MNDLFSQSTKHKPLAEAMRPLAIDDVVGHDDVRARLKDYLAAEHLPNLIFWGPPGVGKTTLARILAKESGMRFAQISAIFSSVAELRKLFNEAHSYGNMLLFVDEIHRFNKSQQDAFLPVMENGEITLIGATTENPSFELNAALMSRAQVMRLERLDEADLSVLLKRAALQISMEFDEAAQLELIRLCDGDGRSLLNMIEIFENSEYEQPISIEALRTRLSQRVAQYDKSGDQHYNLISALHKSVRGSDPDAALYWLSRMLEGGEDPNYLGRRILRMAVEDIALADPQAMGIALQAWQSYERLGSPEGELALAQAVVYLALAPKSNALYAGYKAARGFAKSTGSKMPPKHILNAPTQLMKQEGYGSGYEYDHDAEEGFSGQNYFPDDMKRQLFYAPKERGFERELKKRAEYFVALRAKRQENKGEA